MQIQIKVWSGQNNAVDALAQVLNTIYNDPTDTERFYRGVFTQPYNLISEATLPELEAKGCQVWCDKIENNEPQIHSWRTWGKIAEQIEFKMKEKGFKIESVLL